MFMSYHKGTDIKSETYKIILSFLQTVSFFFLESSRVFLTEEGV